MSAIAIRAEGLSKSYLVGHDASPQRYVALRDVLARNARAVLRRTRDMLGGRAIVQGDEIEEFWALKDVSFTVQKGQVVGIVGRNGAGKSTLLKVLSRITEPTAGRVELRGRVASLLEVGTGFHPELTGRENVFLNGAILGMARREIASKFDRIVAFAEVERFIDTPVKRYSSGMYVRLAFAVAAHLEPDILVIDEVLAVGDQQFQQRCLSKISDVASEGRTVLVVSHNMSVVSSLCDKAMLLAGGRVAQFGETDAVLEGYGKRNVAQTRPDDQHVIDSSLRLRMLACSPEVLRSGGALRIELEMQATESSRVEELCVLVYAKAGGYRTAVIDLRRASGPQAFAEGTRLRWEVDVATVPLVEGEYALGLYCKTPRARGDHYDLGGFSVTPGSTSCEVTPFAAQHRGLVELSYRFENGRCDPS